MQVAHCASSLAESDSKLQTHMAFNATRKLLLRFNMSVRVTFLKLSI
jgi:hypothetical protein